METIKTLAGLIPEGKENAISKRELMDVTGLGDRELRKAIEELRNTGMLIINLGDGNGYYISNDVMELRRQYQYDTSRAMAILKRRKYIRNYLKQRGEQV